MTEAAADRRFLLAALHGLARAPLEWAAGTLRGGAELAVWTPIPPADASPYRRVEYGLAVPATPLEAAAALRPWVPDAAAARWMMEELRPSFGPVAPALAVRAWLKAWRSLMGLLRWPLVVLMGLGGVAVWRDRTGPPGWGRGIVLLAALGLLGHAAFEMPAPRYDIPYQPLLLWLACEGAARTWRVLAR